MMSEKAIDIENVKVSFGAHHVLRGVTCSVERGEIVTFLGRNGCGKSTLLKVVTGNLVPDEGSVTIAGKSVKAYDRITMAREVAFLPQVHEMPRDMTAEELVSCGRYPYQHWWSGVSQKDRDVIRRAMEKTNTLHLRERTVVSLSGGERQRVWIAMALAQEPKILLLDEPTTYLDICHQLEVLELLKELNEKEGLTVVMVLHDINQACRYSTKLMIVEDGVIRRKGRPQDVMTPEAVASVFRVDSELEMKENHPYLYIRGLAGEDELARQHMREKQN